MANNGTATLYDLAELSYAVYTAGGNVPADLGAWGILKQSDPNSDNYYGVAYQNRTTGEIVIANRGTEPASLKDLWSDAQLAAKQVMPAQTDAVNFAKEVAKKYTDATIVETGHSLGGNEAQAADAALENLNLQKNSGQSNLLRSPNFARVGAIACHWLKNRVNSGFAGSGRAGQPGNSSGIGSNFLRPGALSEAMGNHDRVITRSHAKTRSIRFCRVASAHHPAR